MDPRDPWLIKFKHNTRLTKAMEKEQIEAGKRELEQIWDENDLRKYSEDIERNMRFSFRPRQRQSSSVRRGESIPRGSSIASRGK